MRRLIKPQQVACPQVVLRRVSLKMPTVLQPPPTTSRTLQFAIESIRNDTSRSDTPSPGTNRTSRSEGETTAGQRHSTLPRSLHHYMISTAESLPSLSASTPSSNNNDRTSAGRSTASSTALPTQPPPGYSTPLTTSRMGNIPSPPGSFPHQDPPAYSPETNWDELHARSILWRAIEQYFASLPPLATTEEMDLERRRHLLLLWEATNDRHALESRALLGLPPWATTGQVAWRLFVDLLQSRSFTERILNEPELNGERMQTLFPNGYCERCVAEMTMNAMRRASISVPSH